jgi:phytanoyl-CoA hydroxylase
MPIPTSITSDFDRDGYVALPGFLPEGELTELDARVTQFIADVVPAMPREHVFYENKEDPTSLKQLQHLYRYDSYFANIFERGGFRDLAESLLGAPVVLKNLQYFNKPPRVGRPTPAHQDGFYFMIEPCEALTMWLALDHVDDENGCVRYVLGSHRRGMRDHGRTQVLGFSQGIVDHGQPDDLANERAISARPGDLLVHHALTIHRAEGNRSASRSRRALGIICYAVHAKEDATRAASYQRRLQAELAAAGRI